MLVSGYLIRNLSLWKTFPGQNKVLAAANHLGKQQGLSVPNWVPKQPATGIASIENNNT